MIQEHLEHGGGALDIQRLQGFRMQLAEMGKHGLGAKLERARAAGMIPGRRIGGGLQLGRIES